MIAVIPIVNAQSAKNDTIVKLNGKHLIVKIVNNNETNVIFSYPGETMTNTLSKNLIMEIVYSSGRKEKINEKIVINGEKDWKKVKLTTLVTDIEGLVKKGDLDEHMRDLGPIYSSAKKADKKLRIRIKQDAAKLGAHIVLITPMSDANGFRLSGVAYGYN